MLKVLEPETHAGLSQHHGMGPAHGNGTQTISRATLLLKLIARKGLEGTRLSELTKATGLAHPTIRRLLLGLMDEGFIVQDDKTRRYLLGPLNFELGLGAMFKTDFQRTFHPHLERITAETGYTGFLVMRSGADTVCLDRIEGSKPVKMTPFEIGGRRPLGFGAGGLALLSSLPDAEITRILEINKRDIDNHGRLTVDKFWGAIGRTRERGYGLVKDVYRMGVGNIGAVIPTVHQGRRFAVALCMKAENFDARVAAELFDFLTDEFTRIPAGDW